jgi:predicted Fe-S protein YdhL (DUF1289 family)
VSGAGGASADPLSPCTGVCRLDPATGYCAGCRRTVEEIAGWLDKSGEEKRAILTRVASRLPNPGSAR